MSEEAPVEERETGKAPVTPPAPAIDIEAIRSQATEAAKVAAAEAAKEATEATQRLILEERQRMIRAIGGQEEKEDDINPVLRSLLTDTTESLTHVKNAAKQEAKEEIFQALAEREAQQSLVNQVFDPRPDIRTDPMNITIVRGFLEQTDASKPLGDRLREAVTAYDRFMDAKGLGSMQERIAAVSTVPSASAHRGGESQEQARKTEQETWQQELAELQERQRAKRNF